MTVVRGDRWPREVTVKSEWELGGKVTITMRTDEFGGSVWDKERAKAWNLRMIPEGHELRSKYTIGEVTDTWRLADAPARYMHNGRKDLAMHLTIDQGFAVLAVKCALKLHDGAFKDPLVAHEFMCQAAGLYKNWDEMPVNVNERSDVQKETGYELGNFFRTYRDLGHTKG